KTWGGTGNENAEAVIQTSDGGYAVAGRTNGYGAGGYDQTLVKYNSLGIEQWSKTWGGAGTDEAKSLAETADGGIVVVGFTNTYGAGDVDQTVVKYNASGSEQWSKTWGGSWIDEAYDVVAAS